jgi:hypothetical protein
LNHNLTPKALRYKHTGWSFKNFFKKIWAWIFRRGRKGKSTPANPATGDGLVQKTASEADDLSKPVDQSEKNLLKPGEGSPDVGLSKQSEATSAKGGDTPGNDGLTQSPSGLWRYIPWANRASSSEKPPSSQAYWGSWSPWSGKKVQPVDIKSQAAKKAPQDYEDYLGPLSPYSKDKVKLSPKKMTPPASKSIDDQAEIPSNTGVIPGSLPHSA